MPPLSAYLLPSLMTVFHMLEPDDQDPQVEGEKQLPKIILDLYMYT